MNIFLTVLILVQEPQEKPTPPYEATVAVQEAKIRQTTRPLSKIVAIAREKEHVTVLEVKDGKARVRTGGGVEGWMDEHAILETRAYVAKEQAAGTDPTKGAESHAYAKGFDPETESRYKTSKNLQAQYAMLDKLEAYPAYRRQAGVLEERLREFRQQGKLGEFAP